MSVNGRSVIVFWQMSAMTSGEAYFATPGNLARFVLIDFPRREKSRVR